MTKVLYLIVEGAGDKTAAPVLMRRLLYENFQRFEFQIKTMNTLGNGNLTKSDGIERFLELARRDPECKGTIVLLDTERAHRDCPPAFAISLADRAGKLGLPFPVAVVCAACQFESWFLSSLHTIAPEWTEAGSKYNGDPEQECGTKGWLKDNILGRTYKETSDQVSMTHELDIPVVLERSRSFRRLYNAVKELLTSIDEHTHEVTPRSFESA